MTTLGRLTTSYTVWCGVCVDWVDSGSQSNKSKAIRLFKSEGWTHTRKDGWKCPTCSKREAHPNTEATVRND